MVAVRTPSTRNYDELIYAMKTSGNTFAAGAVMGRALEVIENWKKQHDEIRKLIDPTGVDKDKPISVLVADAWALASDVGGKP